MSENKRYQSKEAMKISENGVKIVVIAAEMSEIVCSLLPTMRTTSIKQRARRERDAGSDDLLGV